MPEVDYTRDELSDMLSIYILIDDAIKGSKQIKSKGETYLPKPNSTDTSAENTARYDAYLERAMWTNFVRRTLVGLNGQVFMREPIFTVPDEMQPLVDSVDGEVSLKQQVKQTNSDVLAFGRCGLLTDYPVVDGNPTRLQIKLGEVRPVINQYKPWQVINWDRKNRGSMTILSLVVIVEQNLKATDGFYKEYQDQWRVLDLDENDEYRVRIYTKQPVKVDNGRADIYEFSEKPDEEFRPTDSDGNRWNIIPFTFVGSENNGPDIDFPPMYDIAVLNLGHFRNSADYEESSFIVGQPTPVFSGLTESWMERFFTNNKVYLGSRASISLPEGGRAELLQPDPNTMPYEAMKLKEAQIIALGGKLIQPTAIERTATEANIEKSAENSILASTAGNVGSAYQQHLVWGAKFQGAPTDDIEFVLPTEFDLAMMSPEERRQLTDEVLAGLITRDEARNALRKSGIATLPNDDAFLDIDTKKKEEEERAMSNELKLASQQTVDDADNESTDGA